MLENKYKKIIFCCEKLGAECPNPNDKCTACKTLEQIAFARGIVIEADYW
jgi:hypothetical protein